MNHAKDFDNTTTWACVLSLTGQLMSHMAANPRAHGLVRDMLSAGLAPTPPRAVAASPFHEPLRGLHTREINSAEVMRHFFGR